MMSHTSIFLGGRGSARVVRTSVVSCCDDDLERKERKRANNSREPQDLVEALAFRQTSETVSVL